MTFFIFSSGDCVEKWWWHSLSDQHIGPFTQEIGPKNQLVPKKLGFKTGSRVSLMTFFIILSGDCVEKWWWHSLS